MLAEIIWNTNSIAVIAGCAIPVAAILGGIWYQIERVRSENELKRRMVERGMSAEDIERVMAAGGEKAEASSKV